VIVEHNLQLVDLMIGRQKLEGIMGPSSFTVLEENTDIVHQAELIPHGQIDRQLLPKLTNIWATLGASEVQFMSWILLCSSSHLLKE
jgi:hypothetical protein